MEKNENQEGVVVKECPRLLVSMAGEKQIKIVVRANFYNKNEVHAY
ncbi:MAG: hypothetical protein WBC61_00560 [Dehalococcoidia bacterium]